MSVQVSYKKQFTFFILLILIFAVMVEVILQVTDMIPKKCNFGNSMLFDNLSESEKRNLCEESSRMAGDVSYATAPIRLHYPNQHGSYMNINSDGFRGEEFNFSEKDYKIFFLGGSTTFGSGSLSDETTIPGQVEKKLQANGYDVKVINAGIHSATTIDELYLLENFLLKYNPDMVVMYDGYNDAGDFNLRKFHIPYDEFIDCYAQQNNIPYTQEMIECGKGSGIIKFFEQINYKTALGIVIYYKNYIDTSFMPIDKNYIDTSFMPIDKDVMEPDPKIIDFIEDYMSTNWSKVCSMGKTTGFQTVNFMQPVLGTSDRIIHDDEKRMMSEDWFRSHYLTYLKNIDMNYDKLESCDNVYDLRNTFAGMDGVHIYWDEGHMSDFGYEIIAEKITEKLIPLIENDLSES